MQASENLFRAWLIIALTLAALTPATAATVAYPISGLPSITINPTAQLVPGKATTLDNLITYTPGTNTQCDFYESSDGIIVGYIKTGSCSISYTLINIYISADYAISGAYVGPGNQYYGVAGGVDPDIPAPNYTTINLTVKAGVSGKVLLSGYYIPYTDTKPYPYGSIGWAGYIPVSAGTVCNAVPPEPLSQATLPWGPQTYASYDPNGSICKRGDTRTNCTIRRLGCGLTSLDMALRYVGIEWIPLSYTPITLNPGTLNDFFNAVGLGNKGGYTESRDINWDPAARYFGLKLRFQEFSGKNPLSALDGALCGTLFGAPYPVIVGVHFHLSEKTNEWVPGHFVLVTGTRNGEYQTADPADGKVGTLDMTKKFAIRGVIADPPDLSGLDFSVGDNAELLVTDGVNRQTGYNSTTGTVLQQIPSSTHFVDSLNDDVTGEASGEETHFVYLANLEDGSYTANIIGIDLGTFSLSVHSYSNDGTEQLNQKMVGIVGRGTTINYKILYSTSPTGNNEITLISTYVGTAADIANSLRLGLIDNQGVADALTAEITAAAGAANAGDKATATHILNAFIDTLEAQKSKHVSNFAAEILKKDATSLLSQL